MNAYWMDGRMNIHGILTKLLHGRDHSHGIQVVRSMVAACPDIHCLLAVVGRSHRVGWFGAFGGLGQAEIWQGKLVLPFRCV